MCFGVACEAKRSDVVVWSVSWKENLSWVHTSVVWRSPETHCVSAVFGFVGLPENQGDVRLSTFAAGCLCDGVLKPRGSSSENRAHMSSHAC